MDDRQARDVLIAAFASRGLVPGLTEVQAVQAIGRLESSYGKLHNNWGSVQCHHGPPCIEGECFELTDKHKDGTPYQWCYRAYPTPVDGAANLVRELYRRTGVPAALAMGSATAIAGAMSASGYFEAPVGLYAKAIAMNAKIIAAALGEPSLVTIEGPPGPEPFPVATGAGWLAVAAVGLGLFWLARRAPKWRTA